jgi:hypothetical protein
MDDFSKQKIIYPDIMRMPTKKDLLDVYPYFYFDNKGFYVEATNFILTGNDIDIIFLFLVSNIGFYVFSKFYSGPQFDETGFRYKKEYLHNLVMPELTYHDKNKLRGYFSDNIEISQDKINEISILSEKIFGNAIGLEFDEFDMINRYKPTLLHRKTHSN